MLRGTSLSMTVETNLLLHPVLQNYCNIVEMTLMDSTYLDVLLSIVPGTSGVGCGDSNLQLSKTRINQLEAF